MEPTRPDTYEVMYAAESLILHAKLRISHGDPARDAGLIIVIESVGIESDSGYAQCLEPADATVRVALLPEGFTATRALDAAFDPRSTERDLLAKSVLSPVLTESIEHLMSSPLTSRELEVLHLIAAGCSNQEIADRLFVGVSTVKKHINHIFDKLDVKNRTQAVAYARTLHIVT
jgi:LuxR family maltose regulon positive regulatory protein